MKLFELYNKRSTKTVVHESKTLTACNKLCEGMIRVLEASDEYYFIQAGIDKDPQKFKSILAATRGGNQLFGKYRVQTLRIKHKVPGEKAETVKTLKLNEASYEGMIRLLEYNRPDDFNSNKIAKGTDSIFDKNQKKQPLTEAPGRRVTDPTALKVKEIATQMFGDQYSSARIGGGKIHRISIPIGPELSKSYRYVSLADIEPRDKKTLIRLKSELFAKLQHAGVDLSKVDVKYHVGAGVYMSVRTNIDETVEEASYEGGIDFEPQPDFKNVKGVTRDTGAGEQDRKAAEKKKQNAKLNQTWQLLVRKLSKLDRAGAERLKVNLAKVAKVAKQKDLQLNPPPEEVLGR